MSKDNNGQRSGFLHIKELKEKVRSLISEVDLNRENAKFNLEKNVEPSTSEFSFGYEIEDEFLDTSEIESMSETSWLLKVDASGESVKEICDRVYSGLDENPPDITNLIRYLESASHAEPNIFSSQKPSIDSRTFTRPKKCLTRPPLTSVLNSEEGRPKLQKRLTTTSPSPNLISKLEELSKTNNRPVSGNYDDVKWEDGSEDSLAEIKKPNLRSKQQSLPASLFDRLQELKKANNSFKIGNVIEQGSSNRRLEEKNNPLLEDAKKVTAALDVYLKNSHSSGLSEIFRNIQDYYSDDNDSFINLDEVSGFCDRLTLSTDQSTYSSIVREMEQNEICLFHRPLKYNKTKERRMTFGGVEIPSKNSPGNVIVDEEDADLNRAYEIDGEDVNNRGNIISTENIKNTTYETHKKPNLVGVVIKNLPANRNVKKGLNNNDDHNSSGSDNSFNNNNINNTTVHNKTSRQSGSDLMNYAYQKLNCSSLDQNELNACRGLKYSTKVFDSSFGRRELETARSSAKKSNGKKEQSDHSEDDCMSTTSDHSYRSVESNSETKPVEISGNGAVQQKKKFSSTPTPGYKEKFDFGGMSPIEIEIGDGESRAHSNPSSRGQSPRRGLTSIQQEGIQKHRMPNLRQPLKVPQRELKLKPTLVRPSQNFKRPLSYARTSSEPSVPQKVEAFQPVASVPALRPLEPAAVPSLTNVRPARVSGIPRPPTRLKPPQIRFTYPKK